MKEITTTNSETGTIGNKLFQPHLIIQALAFTAILHFCLSDTFPNHTTIRYEPVQTEIYLSKSVSKAVLQYTAKHSHLPISSLHLVDAQPYTWSDKCLGLGQSGVNCTQMPVPGWQIAIASGQQRWLYRTNASGSVIKLEASN